MTIILPASFLIIQDKTTEKINDLQTTSTMKSIPSLLTILLSSLAAISQVTINAQLSHLPARDYRPQWLADTHVQRRTNLLKRWFANGPIGLSPEQRSLSSPFDTLQSPKQFKGKHYLASARKFTVAHIYRSLGCIDPSEPFQCPQSQRCIALQFICDGHPGDCPGNFDENEETCIAGQLVSCIGVLPIVNKRLSVF